MVTYVVLLALAAVAAVVVIVLYNHLVSLRNRAEGAWSDIDVQLKRRHNLIPNLVETVKGYAGHERQTLAEVTEARGRAQSAEGAAAQADAEGALTRAISHLFAVAEAYPDLKASESFQRLQGELSSLEEAIQNARRYYNAIVRDLNTACDTFPSNAVAGWFGIGKEEYFELDATEQRAVPHVDFSA